LYVGFLNHERDAPEPALELIGLKAHIGRIAWLYNLEIGRQLRHNESWDPDVSFTSRISRDLPLHGHLHHAFFAHVHVHFQVVQCAGACLVNAIEGRDNGSRQAYPIASLATEQR
jgi:hypothetical protein